MPVSRIRPGRAATFPAWIYAETSAKADVHSHQSEYHTQERTKTKQYLNMRDSPPISRLPRDTSARCAHRTATRLKLALEPLSNRPRRPQIMVDPLSARAGWQAAERPKKYISKGSSQRDVAPERAYEQHREAGLHHDWASNMQVQRFGKYTAPHVPMQQSCKIMGQISA